MRQRQLCKAVVPAWAKLTVSLRVTGVRADGYHLIDAEMVTLDVADVVTIEPAHTTHIEVLDAAGRPAPVGEPGDNLAVRAARLAGVEARIRIEKHIPPGAGLGGGSADAAAVLRWAGYTDIPGAAQLGSDVPFCLAGGRARVRGIGERIESLPFVAQTFTLLTPPFGCDTPSVYQAWDELGGPTGPNGNDLEPAALAVHPGLVEFRDQLAAHSGRTPRLAGSGSTWFVEGAFPGEGFVVARTVAAAPLT
ncbi:MAG: 4-(cytidine 5'-diphospho)-2-C-methyl-D-erythritol kinase [Acidimicrobiales bacterium]|nr:4-(cytidine 5'-diphospho)-2-C-methyl-D-erythritol kinase [Acidimicrobiales bacterium]